MSSTIFYDVSWYVCDESSFAGGNWDVRHRYFDKKEDGIIFAKSLPKPSLPIIVTKMTKERILKIG